VLLQRLVKSQQRGWPDDDGCSLDTARTEEQRPEAEQDSVERREIGRAPPRPIEDQELLLSCRGKSEALGLGEIP